MHPSHPDVVTVEFTDEKLIFPVWSFVSIDMIWVVLHANPVALKVFIGLDKLKGGVPSILSIVELKSGSPGFCHAQNIHVWPFDGDVKLFIE